MNPLSQNVKNFLTQFESTVLPHINMGKTKDKFAARQPITCYISAASMLDPQLQDLIGVSPGNKNGIFMGVSIVAKPDMSVETFYETETRSDI